MLQQIDKKKNIYIYLFIFLFLTTISNIDSKNFIKKNFKILNLEIINKEIKIEELNYLINKNILKLDKEEIIKILEDYPSLNSFKINKVYPNTLRIEFSKTKPLAKIMNNNYIYYLGENGKFFKENNIDYNVPIINGNFNLTLLLKYLKLIKKSSLNLNEISFINFYPSGRFDLIFKSKKIVKFPKKDVFKFMQKAHVFLNDNRFTKKVIDFRINNRIILSNE